MLLQNTSKRLITINAPLLNGQRAESYRIKCGLDNRTEVPDELCRNAFVRGLVKEGDLIASGDLDDQVEESVEDGLDDMNKDELTEYAESMGVDVKSAWTKADIIEAVRAQ